MGERQVVQFRGDDELVQWLDKRAAARRVKRSVVIRELLWAAKDAEAKAKKKRASAR